MVRVLLETPHLPPLPEVMALIPAEHRERVGHVASDFLSKLEDIVKQHRENYVTADVAFFCSHVKPKPPPGSSTK